MEMDYDLLDIAPSDSTEVVDNSDSISVELPAQAEPKTVPLETQPVQEQTATDFDDSVPLTPREKLLMERLDRITGENLAFKAPAASTATVPPVPSDRNFLDGLDMDEVLATPEGLNRLLLSVHNSALDEASKLTAERILQNLPQIMSTYVTNHMSMAKMAEKFYTDNADLAGSSQTVATVANKIAAEHPEYTAEQVFDASAIEARKILRIKAAAITPELAIKPAKPAFVPPGRARNGVVAPVLSEIEKGVLDLIS